MKNESHVVRKFYNPLDALACIEKEPVSLAILDVMMPVMNGMEAAKAIRALPRPDAKEIPIIVLTANAFMAGEKKSLEAGMNAHLPKPMDAEKLCQLIWQLLHQNTPE